MRKIESSGNTFRSTLLSARAESRSRPNGFSTTTREPCVQPVAERFSTIVGNALGGIAGQVRVKVFYMLEFIRRRDGRFERQL